MPFDQSTITSGPTIDFDMSDFLVSWDSSDPDGTTFHLYINGELAYSGMDRSVHLPFISNNSILSVGKVDDDETRDDFSDSLPTIPGAKQKASLAWYGGRYESLDIAGFHIYVSVAAGLPIGTVPVATILATELGRWEDGYGRGRFGKGGFGYAEIPYQWTSDFLGRGLWNFAVVPYNASGNEGTASATMSVTVAAAPNSPSIGSDGRRLRYTYNSTTRVAALSWLASTG